MNIKIYGSRGTTPGFNRECIVYGGNTVCVRIRMNSRTIVLDCGSGLAGFAADFARESPADAPVDILLSCLNIDHIIGLPSFGALFASDSNIRLFTRPRSDDPLIKQIFGAFKPPYWHVDLSDITTAGAVPVGREPFALGGGITVRTLGAGSPDKAVSFRLDGEKTVVYMPDVEIDGAISKRPELIEFCRGTDAVIFDSSYMPDARTGWGRSGYSNGIDLAEASGAGKIIFCHHTRYNSDPELDAVQRILDGIDSTRYKVAFDDMELEI